MRHLILAAATAAAGLTLAVPAAAQDAPPPFTGLRVEGLLGYDSLNDGGGQPASSSDGLSYGALVGYDIAAGPAIVGIEGEITDSTTDTRTNNLLVTNDRLRLDAGRDLYAGLRAGYVISPVAMAYVKGGYTNARVKARYDAPGVAFSDSDDLDGFRLGAGLEYAIMPNAFVKGEYRYSHYGEQDRYDVDLDRHQLMAGVGFRF